MSASNLKMARVKREWRSGGQHFQTGQPGRSVRTAAFSPRATLDDLFRASRESSHARYRAGTASTQSHTGVHRPGQVRNDNPGPVRTKPDDHNVLVRADSGKSRADESLPDNLRHVACRSGRPLRVRAWMTVTEPVHPERSTKASDASRHRGGGKSGPAAAD